MGEQTIGKEEGYDAPIQFLLYGKDYMNQQSFATEFGNLMENVEHCSCNALLMPCISHQQAETEYGLIKSVFDEQSCNITR